jgi:glycosyltransferase involved in cell wall biosynthesis
MPASPQIICTVTNDLNFDQRMIRICTSLSSAGYRVLLVGRNYRNSPRLQQQPFLQKRLRCFFRTGKLFYIEYNLRLFYFLLGQKADLLCAIDLDTILPVLYASKLKRTKRVYDAHELFTEMKEVVSRPHIFWFWKWIERHAVPQFRLGYTVNKPIRDLLFKEYGVDYAIVRNVPVLQKKVSSPKTLPYILYQGAVNEGRSFETLIPAFQWINMPLHIYGDGNFLNQAQKLVVQYRLQAKVLFKGKLEPGDLRAITASATLGITLFENLGLSNYYSLANRFFDYMHAGIPQLCVAYPAYSEINAACEVAVLIRDLSPQNIAASINGIISNNALQQQLRGNCAQARNIHNWQEEEKLLIRFYQKIFG